MNKKRKLYLVVLREYGGEVTSKFVDKETWDWIHSPPPDFKGMSSAPDMVPDAVKNNSNWGWSNVEAGLFIVTTGSWENDRAIQAPGAEGTKEFYDLSQTPAQEYVKKHGIEIVEVYDGVMY